MSSLDKETENKITHAPEEASSSVGETLGVWQNVRNSRKCTETKTFHYYILFAKQLSLKVLIK